MSRSYRTLHGKEEVFFIKNNSKGEKRLANHSFRKHTKNVYEDVPSNNGYKKHWCSYNIADWIYRCSLHRLKKFNGRRYYFHDYERRVTIEELYRFVIK